jgi:hypothetical protein
LPQTPQLLSSVWGLMQIPLQSSSPVPQVTAHLP